MSHYIVISQTHTPHSIHPRQKPHIISNPHIRCSFYLHNPIQALSVPVHQNPLRPMQQEAPPLYTLPGKRCRRTKPFLLYHWAPASRRKSIKRNGLLIGRKHVKHSPGWRATYLCFSDSPSYAWALSGEQLPPNNWDLWMVWSINVPDLCYRFDHVNQLPAEYRTNHSIAPRHLWRVASRNTRINSPTP